MAVDGGDGDGVAQAQVIELVEIRVRDAGGVHLVDGQDDGLAGAQQHRGHLLVRRGKARADVAEEDNDGGVLNGDLRLLAHEIQNLAVAPGLDAAGIDEGELPAAPVALAVDAVPGDAGGILHDGKALAGDLVEEHGLAHVGAAHDGDDGFGHGVSTSFMRGLRGGWPQDSLIYLFYPIFPGRARGKRAKGCEKSVQNSKKAAGGSSSRSLFS